MEESSLRGLDKVLYLTLKSKIVSKRDLISMSGDTSYHYRIILFPGSKEDSKRINAADNIKQLPVTVYLNSISPTGEFRFHNLDKDEVQYIFPLHFYGEKFFAVEDYEE